MADERILSALREGYNCVVEAVPGGVKTTLLIAATEISPLSLVLTYNNRLCAMLKAVMNDENVTCMTFHALCARHLGTCRDDEQMSIWVEQLERGDIKPAPQVPAYDLLLLDEAQDIRSLYVRLLKGLGLLKTTQKIVVGDEHQLLYDFDPMFPSSLDALLQTEDALALQAARSGRGLRRRLLSPHPQHRLQS